MIKWSVWFLFFLPVCFVCISKVGMRFWKQLSCIRAFKNHENLQVQPLCFWKGFLENYFLPLHSHVCSETVNTTVFQNLLSLFVAWCSPNCLYCTRCEWAYIFHLFIQLWHVSDPTHTTSAESTNTVTTPSLSFLSGKPLHFHLNLIMIFCRTFRFSGISECFFVGSSEQHCHQTSIPSSHTPSCWF